ncbi:U-box domain-containing protein [Haematococcus lacustris]|uniref:U-box domain-containing protein n=1 Tax=Haematococcus lacustris TaxID=44745 RepID=A0A699Z5J4_HAELA|nr:U-box domain-containing protein [Haematococcus lacustris]
MQNPPEDFLCPITRELLNDPVIIVETGHSYERLALLQWWSSTHNFTCPKTGQASPICVVAATLIALLALTLVYSSYRHFHCCLAACWRPHQCTLCTHKRPPLPRPSLERNPPPLTLPFYSLLSARAPCPLISGIRLQSLMLTPNWALRSAINSWASSSGHTQGVEWGRGQGAPPCRSRTPSVWRLRGWKPWAWKVRGAAVARQGGRQPGIQPHPKQGVRGCWCSPGLPCAPPAAPAALALLALLTAIEELGYRSHPSPPDHPALISTASSGSTRASLQAPPPGEMTWRSAAGRPPLAIHRPTTRQLTTPQPSSCHSASTP